MRTPVIAFIACLVSKSTQAGLADLPGLLLLPEICSHLDGISAVNLLQVSTVFRNSRHLVHTLDFSDLSLVGADLEFLRAFTGVRTLNLSGTDFTDSSFLRSFPLLESVDLSQRDDYIVKDNRDFLDCSDRSILIAETISEDPLFPTVLSLTVGQDNVGDLRCLKHFPNLKEFRLRVLFGKARQAIDPIRHLSSLRHLETLTL